MLAMNLNIFRILPWKLSFVWHPKRGPINSKDLSALLGDKIKPKSTKLPVLAITTALLITTSFYTKNRSLLIQLFMQCDGCPIATIIDTGSQLNIVNKNICNSKIMHPVDNKENISVADV